MPEILVNVYRDQLIESSHYGDIVVVSKKGQIIYRVGNQRKISYWRSAAKPFQVLPVVLSGAADKYNFTDKELAVMTASHSGEKQHVELIYSILNKIGLDERALLCGTHLPYHKPTAQFLIQNKKRIKPVYNNCSGKHAGLLALCCYYDWSIDNYYQQDHPAQKLLLKIVSEFTGYPRENIFMGEDGCGVIVFGLPLKNMAYAYTRLVNPELLPSKYRRGALRIINSMKKHPEIIAGSGRFNTDLMQVAGDKLTAKSGAEGIFCMGLKNGAGIAIKIIDGNKRAVPPVVVELLSQLSILSKKETEKLKNYHYYSIINNHDHIVGKIKPVFELI